MRRISTNGNATNGNEINGKNQNANISKVYDNVSTPIGRLPINMVLKVLSFVDHKTLGRLCSVSKTFYLIASDAFLWRALFEKRFNMIIKREPLAGLNWKKLYQDQLKRKRELTSPSKRNSRATKPKPQWIDDNSVVACRICKNEFNFVNRRHHCRWCGDIFCNDCCTKRLELPEIGYNSKQRVCNPCFSKLTERPSTLNNEKKQLASLKIVVLGDSACGKTCLIHRLIARSFNDQYTATTGASFVSTARQNVDGRMIKLQIWDTSGDLSQSRLISMYLKDCSAVLLCFDPTSTHPLRIPELWLKKIDNDEDVARPQLTALVATKTDKLDKWKVSPTDIDSFVLKNRLDLFAETSAKSSLAIEELFQTIVDTCSLVVD